MYNIQTLNKISKYGTDNFDTSKYIISDASENPDALASSRTGSVPGRTSSPNPGGPCP